jgi:hypothetical protein
MYLENEISLRMKVGASSLWSIAILVASVAAGFSFLAFDLTARRSALFCLAVLLGTSLLLYPELALALYVVVGDVKGDDRVAALLPWDMTLALGGFLVAGIILNLLRKKPMIAMPSVYFLFIPLLVIMVASLTYTPIFDAGLEKTGRFLSVTGIVIVAPFFVLGTPQAMKRFLYGFAIVALAICGYSLGALGGSERLVTPSSNTIGLGHIACCLILIILFGVMPHLRFLQRMLLYPILASRLCRLSGQVHAGPW